jgi:hypothetical protein
LTTKGDSEEQRHVFTNFDLMKPVTDVRGETLQALVP